MNPDSSVGKESAYNSGDLASIPGSGRSPGEWKGYPLQYSGLENSTDSESMGSQRVRHDWSNLPSSYTRDIQYRFCCSIILFMCVCTCAIMSNSSVTPMDCGLPGSSVHGILQARILEWVTFPSSSRSSQPRYRTQVSHILGRCFISLATKKAQEYWTG